MKIGILVSKTDHAGMNIADKLKTNYEFVGSEEEFRGDKVYVKQQGGDEFKLVIFNESQLYADFVNDFDAELLVFASRHSSKSGTSTLTAHPIGNFGRAELGGKDKELVKSNAHILRNYYLNLKKEAEERKMDYKIGMEVTHHGPYLEKPAAYIEVGSSIEQWKDNEAADVIAKTILLQSKTVGNSKIAIGIGGNHYCAIFNKVIDKHNYAFSHIVPQYALLDLDKEMLQKTIEASVFPVEEIVVDKKGLGKEKPRIMELLNDTGLQVQEARKI